MGQFQNVTLGIPGHRTMLRELYLVYKTATVEYTQNVLLMCMSTGHMWPFLNELTLFGYDKKKTKNNDLN